MTLKGVAPLTVAFSDRPECIAGRMSTKEFIPFWSEGKDSFLKDLPNANVSILDGGTVADVVVVVSNPLLMGDDLTYDIRILDGQMPAKGGWRPCSSTLLACRSRRCLSQAPIAGFGRIGLSIDECKPSDSHLRARADDLFSWSMPRFGWRSQQIRAFSPG
jgi:hypothetical protein